MKQLRKSRNAVISGVCGGVAEYFNIDPIIIRLVWLFSGIGIIPYIVCAILLPPAVSPEDIRERNPYDYENRHN